MLTLAAGDAFRTCPTGIGRGQGPGQSCLRVAVGAGAGSNRALFAPLVPRGTFPSPPPGLLGNPINMYRPTTIAKASFANSVRLADLVKDGKIYLSLSDAIALALEEQLRHRHCPL